MRCGGIDGGNGHLFPLGYQACVFVSRVCLMARSSGFRGSRLMELSSFSLFSRLPPQLPPFYLLRSPMQSGTVRACGCCILVCAEGVENTWMHGFFMRFRLDRCKENVFFLAVSCPCAGAWPRRGVISRRSFGCCLVRNLEAGATRGGTGAC